MVECIKKVRHRSKNSFLINPLNVEKQPSTYKKNLFQQTFCLNSLYGRKPWDNEQPCQYLYHWRSQMVYFSNPTLSLTSLFPLPLTFSLSPILLLGMQNIYNDVILFFVFFHAKILRSISQNAIFMNSILFHMIFFLEMIIDICLLT